LNDLIPFIVNLKVPSSPRSVNLTAINCGTVIKAEWNRPSSGSNITGYQMNLLSLTNNSKRVFNLAKKVHSKILAAESNFPYEVYIRAKNSAGFGPWTKQQLITTAGIVKTGL